MGSFFQEVATPDADRPKEGFIGIFFTKDGVFWFLSLYVFHRCKYVLSVI